MSIIDGEVLASKIKEQVKEEMANLGFKPGLAVILVGDNPASKIYVEAKEEACKEVGFYSEKIVLPKDITDAELIGQIHPLNRRDDIHGILVQLPLPKGLNQASVLQMIDIPKDVDCLHPFNFGLLAFARKVDDLDDFLAPCTAKGVIKLIESTGESIAGKKAVVIGRSILVGKPTVLLLSAKGATVTVCHSKTENLAEEIRQADILVAAIGREKSVKAEMVKKGAIVIDVGINRFEDRVVGDVDFEEVKEKASFITPVPGGVGPMTVACLLENTLLLAKRKIKLGD